MHCGRISVEGDAEEFAVSPSRPKFRQRHGKRSLNPYSTTGLDKFESVYAELSAKREYIAQKTGAPEAMVRFVSSKDGWIPVVLGAPEQEIMRTNNSSGAAAGVSVAEAAENNNEKTGGKLRRKDEENAITGESENISTSMSDERIHSLVMPWSRFLKNTALGLGFLGVSAMWVKFILWGVASYLAALFRNPNSVQEAIAEKENGGRRDPHPSGFTVSAPTSPLRAQGYPTDFWATASSAVKLNNIDPGHKHIHQSKAKVCRRAVSMDNQPTRAERSESFYRTAMAYDGNVGATAMIITLLFFAFYGPFCAILFACACLYLIRMFRNDEWE